MYKRQHPDKQEKKNPPPDPNMILAQAQVQAINQDIQIKGMKAQADIAMDQQKMDAEVENINADTQAKLANAAEAGVKAGSAQIKATNEALSQTFAQD